jgi:phosphatidylinositol-3-phosphatase
LRTHLSLFLVLVALLAASVAGKSPQVFSEATMTQTSSSLDYVVTILMENHPLNTSYPNGIIGNPNLPYINSLARNYSLANYYFAVTSGSLPDYIALTDANITSVNPTCSNPGPGCTTNALNIVDRVEGSGRTWKAYMEDYSGGCNGTGTSNYYVAIHNPFVFYADITNNITRCARIVSANPGHQGLPDNQLLSDLNSTTTASNYMWLTPDNCDNMHGECSITTGDNYLSQLIPEILNSTVFKTQRAALFLVFDEPTSCPYNQCPVPAIWAGPFVKIGYSSNTHYTHYSLLATLENVWNLQPLNSLDGTASAMVEFLIAPLGPISVSVNSPSMIFQGINVTTTASILVNPANLTFSGTATVTAQNATTSTLLFTKTYSIPASPLRVQGNLEALFLLIVPVAPYPLSVNLDITVGSGTAASIVSVTRQVDIDARGRVDIVDAATLAAAFDSTPTSQNWNPQADIYATGRVNILDAAYLAFLFDAPSFA